MNEIFAKLLSFFTSVVLPIIVGYGLKELLHVPKKKLDVLLLINIMFVLPISLALVFWNIEISADLVYLPIIGFLSPLVSCAIGFLMCRNRFEDMRQKGSYIIASMLNNRGTIGGLTMYILYGELGLAYVNLIILFAGINIYFIAHPLGNYYGNTDKKIKYSIKSVIFRKTNLPIVGMIVGIALNIFAGERPDSMSVAIDPMVKIIAWLSLIPIGSSIDFHGMKQYIRKTLDLALLKFIIMPVLTALVCIPLISDPLQATTLIAISATPVAINAVVVAKLNNLDENVIIASFLSTLLIYLVIIFPIMCIIFV